MKHIHFSKAFCCLVTFFVTSLAFSQDIIVTTDAQKIEAKILEVSKHEIKYKEKDNLNGPTFVLETNEISSILYSNGKVVLYNQKPEEKVNAEKETPKEPDIDPRLAEILLLSGETITAKISNMNSNYVEYELNETYYTLPASKIDKVTLLASGQVKTYKNYITNTAENSVEKANATQTQVKNSDGSKVGRIYRDNGHYLHNDVYISSKEVERILQRENSLAYDKWKKANGMIIGGSVCVGIGGGMVLGSLFFLNNAKVCLGLDLSAIVPLGIGLGLTLGASSYYQQAIDIYNSKYDQAAIQFKWGITPDGIGIALAF